MKPTMKTAVITRKHVIELQEQTMPDLGEHDVLIKVVYVGICGSDVHLFHDLHPFRKPPMIPGHEMAGEIVQVGSGVTRHRVGERVVVNHAIPCGTCRYCKAGQINICPDKIVAGSSKMMGFFAEYIRVPESTLFPIADGISYEAAALAEPLSIGFHIIRRIRRPEPGPIAIVGAGTIGLVALIAARHLGYTEIYAVDPIEYNLEVALRLGATKTFNPRTTDAASEILACTGGVGVQATVLTATARDVITQSFAMTSLTGTIVMLPMTAEPLEANFYRLVAGEQSLIGCRGIEGEDFQQAVELINSGFDFGPLVTHIMPMSQAQQAFDRMVDRTEPVIKILIQPDR